MMLPSQTFCCSTQRFPHLKIPRSPLSSAFLSNSLSAFWVVSRAHSHHHYWLQSMCLGGGGEGREGMERRKREGGDRSRRRKVGRGGKGGKGGKREGGRKRKGGKRMRRGKLETVKSLIYKHRGWHTIFNVVLHSCLWHLTICGGNGCRVCEIRQIRIRGSGSAEDPQCRVGIVGLFGEGVVCAVREGVSKWKVNLGVDTTAEGKSRQCMEVGHDDNGMHQLCYWPAVCSS